MNLGASVFRFVLLMLPGTICILIYKHLKHRKQKKDWEDLIEVFLFSVLSYVILDLCKFLLSKIIGITDYFTFFKAMIDDKIELPVSDVVWASALSVAIAYVSSFIYHKKLINKIGRKIGVTNHFGDETVWEYFFNLDGIGDWAIVRNHRNDILYYGNIRAFSEGNELREIILHDVSVHKNSTGEHLYNTRMVHLSELPEFLSVEVPAIPSDKA